METPPPPASKEEKRPRKRSRYLSPPYNDTLLLQDDDGDIISPASHEEQEEDSNVATADLLAALLQCAADASSAYSSASSSSSSSSPAPAHVLLRFLGLYRASLLPKLDDTHSSAALALPAPARGILTCRAMAIAHGSASTNICCIGPPAAAAQAASKKNKKKVTFAADGNANNASSTPDKKKKKKRRKSSTGQQHFFRSPAALVLDFTQDQDLPSKEELLSTFRGFGFVVESHTGVSTDGRSARVVFGSSAQAKAAYSCAHTLGLGKLGPPFAIPRLEHLPPIIFGPSSSSPAPKLPLAVMRKNLDKMITSLTCSPSFTKDGAQRLAGEMQRLLARVDNKLSAGPSATAAQNH